MSTEQIDFEGLGAALQKLFAVKTPEEGIAILQQHPELLSEEADMMLDKLIHHAREQGNDDEAQLFSHARELLQSLRQAIAEAQGNERNDMPEQIDFDALWATFQKLFAANTREESTNILQQHPELLSEDADMMLDNLIHHAREQGNDDDIQLFSHIRELLQSIRQQENQDNNIQPVMSTEQIDYQAIPVAFWSFIDAATQKEATNILQQSPELLSEQVIKQLDLMINDARIRGDEKIAQTFEEKRVLLQTFEPLSPTQEDNQTTVQSDTNQAQQPDFKAIPAFWSFIDAATQKEATNILQQSPELLSEHVIKQLDLMINDARIREDEKNAQTFEEKRVLLKTFEPLSPTQEDNQTTVQSDTNQAQQPDFKAIPAFWSFIDAATEKEARNILQQSPELLSEQVIKQLDLMINDARIREDEKNAQTFEEKRVLLQTFEPLSPTQEDNQTTVQSDINQAQQPDFKAIPVAFWSFIDAATEKEARNILQQSPELLSEQVIKQLDLMINDARVSGDEKNAQTFEEKRVLRQMFTQQAKKGNDKIDIPALFQADIKQANAAEARYEQGEGMEALDEAIAAWERILNHPAFAKANPEGELRFVVLNDSATTFMRRYGATGILADLNNALSCWEELESTVPSDSPYLPAIQNNLGLGFSNRYQRTGELTDLEKSIVMAQKAVDLTPEGSPDLHAPLNNLGNRLLDRYLRTGELTDLQESIAKIQKAVQLTPRSSPDLPKRLNNLGSCLSNRYRRTGDLTDLEDSIANTQEAVDLTPKGSPYLPSRLNNLGSRLSYRYQHTGELTDLQEGLYYTKKAVKLTPVRSPDLPGYLTSLGSLLSYLYQRTNSLSDLDESIAKQQKAVDLTPKESPELPKRLNNLGNCLSDRYKRTCDVADFQQAIAAYKKATQRGLEVQLEWGLNSASNWLRWAFERQAWPEVIEAYDYAYQASTRLVQIQSMRQHQESWLKESQGLAAHAAYAFAKQNQLTQATVTLERGLAQLLSEALARDRADLAQLKAQGHRDLYARYQQAVTDWHEAQQFANAFAQPTPEQSEQIYQHFRTARETLDNTIAAIRQIDGYSDFLTAPGFTDIVAAVKDTALVYLVVTKAGGLALIVNEGSEITPVWLPELTEETLQHTLVSIESPDSGYFRAYKDWLTHPKKDSYRQQWSNSLETTTQLLWNQVMAPLIQALPTSAPITLIPVGRLGLLPFHAAWSEDNNTPTGKRYALDVLTISYAPNARALTEARKVAQRVTADRLLAVDEPKPVTNNKGKALPLPSSEYEVQTVVAKFAQPHIFKHEAATRQAILAALPDCNVLHCSCHGSANLKKPLESALMMAHNESLTVKDFLELRLNGVRLATLSACETGMPGMTLPDEVVNLPTGLLQAGIAGVVASLWSVNDMSTALLMIKFYQEVLTRWQEYGTQASIAPALQAAQCWLRDATKEELQAWVNQLTLTPAQRMQFMVFFSKMSEKPKPEKPEKPFSAPFYWAAFCAIGQ
jgi:CHAT domain-containing protein